MTDHGYLFFVLCLCSVCVSCDWRGQYNARSSQVPILISRAFMSLLYMPLNLRWGQPTPFTLSKLSVEHLFWNAAIFHSLDMVQPAKSVLPEKGAHVQCWSPCVARRCRECAGDSSGGRSWAFTFLYVVHVLLPYNNVLSTQALYNAILVFMISLGFVQTRFVSLASVVEALPLRLSISTSIERLLVMVNLR